MYMYIYSLFGGILYDTVMMSVPAYHVHVCLVTVRSWWAYHCIMYMYIYSLFGGILYDTVMMSVPPYMIYVTTYCSAASCTIQSWWAHHRIIYMNIYSLSGGILYDIVMMSVPSYHLHVYLLTVRRYLVRYSHDERTIVSFTWIFTHCSVVSCTIQSWWAYHRIIYMYIYSLFGGILYDTVMMSVPSYHLHVYLLTVRRYLHYVRTIVSLYTVWWYLIQYRHDVRAIVSLYMYIYSLFGGILYDTVMMSVPSHHVHVFLLTVRLYLVWYSHDERTIVSFTCIFTHCSVVSCMIQTWWAYHHIILHVYLLTVRWYLVWYSHDERTIISFYMYFYSLFGGILYDTVMMSVPSYHFTCIFTHCSVVSCMIKSWWSYHRPLSISSPASKNLWYLWRMDPWLYRYFYSVVWCYKHYKNVMSKCAKITRFQVNWLAKVMLTSHWEKKKEKAHSVLNATIDSLKESLYFIDRSYTPLYFNFAICFKHVFFFSELCSCLEITIAICHCLL